VAGIIGVNLANWVIGAGGGEIGVLVVIMILTEILGALITSKAAGLVVFPIGAAAGAKLHIPHNRILIALMLGASDYTTPQGHQINLMIQSPGAYQFIDYQKLGIPFEIFLNIFQVICLYFIDYPYVTIPIAFVFLVFCICFDHTYVQARPIFSLSIFHPLALLGAFRDFFLGLIPSVPVSLQKHEKVAPRSRTFVERILAKLNPFRCCRNKAPKVPLAEAAEPDDDGPDEGLAKVIGV